MLHGLGKLASRAATLLRSRGSARIAAAVFMFVVCAASYNGYYQKYSLHEAGWPGADSRFTLDKMFAGTAYRPFVYRRLMLDADNVVQKLTPEHVRSLILRVMHPGVLHKSAESQNDPFRYLVMYFLGFFALLFSGFATYFVVGRSCTPIAAIISSAALILFIPILQAGGGSIYDFSELFFLSLAIVIARTRFAPLIVILAPVAAYNKESFVFFIPTLLPFLMLRYGPVVALAWISGACAAGLAVYLAVTQRFSANAGGAVEFHLKENALWYINPIHLASHDWTYGMLFFNGYSLVTGGILLFLVANGWSSMKKEDRRHLILAVAINTPLYILFAYPGEVRNLSLTFPALALLGGAAIDRILRSQSAAPQRVIGDEAAVEPLIRQGRARA